MLANVTKTLRVVLERLSLPAIAFALSFVLLAARGDWPAVVGLAVCAAVYVLADVARLSALLRELDALRTKLTKIANRLGD